MQALGMIETRGLTGAVEALDAMLKSANVTFVSKEKVGSGLITIMVTGDIGAVKASVDAGAAAAERLSQLVGVHVMARPHDDLELILKEENQENQEESLKEELKIEKKDELLENKSLEDAVVEEKKEGNEALEEKKNKELSKKYLESSFEKEGLEFIEKEIKKASFNNLKKLIKEYSDISIAKKDFAKINKDTLIEKLLTYYKGKNS